MRNAIMSLLAAFIVCMNALAQETGYVYEKVTSADQLIDGATYIIVNETYGMAVGYQKSSNRYGVSGLTFTDNTLTLTESQIATTAAEDKTKIYEFTLKKPVGTIIPWVLYDTVNAQHLTINNSGNSLVCQGKKSLSECYCKITISDAGDATIVFYNNTNKNSSNTIRYYNASNNPLFSCYSSSNQPVQLYRKKSSVGSFTISAVGYATYYADEAYVMPKGVMGYTVTMSGDVLSFNEAYAAGAVVPAGTALLLNGEAKTYEYAVTTSEETAPENNLLHGSSTEAETQVEGATAYYALSTDDNGNNLGFYWMNDNGAAFTNGAHKAYLALSGQGASQMRAFVIPSETSSVGGVRSSRSALRQAYDLQGRSVVPQNARHGLYIINGKKTLVK